MPRKTVFDPERAFEALIRASDRKISPMKKEIAMQTSGTWTKLRATATGATVLGN
jgi:hypothetical protein